MEQLIRALGKNVYIDANVVIYAVEGFPAFQSILESFFACVDNQILRLVTSELTIAEALVKPIADKNNVIQQAYRAFLEPTPQLSLVPISRAILESAAAIRAESGAKLPDAIHIATARHSACSSFVSNDRLIRSAIDIPVFRMEELDKLMT